MRISVLTLLLLACSTAWSAPVQWTLSNMPIEGSFTYDADTNTYSDVLIDSVFYPFIGYSDSYLPPFVLENGLDNDNTASTLGAWTIYDGYGTFTLQLDFASALSNAGGTVDILATSREASNGGLDGSYEYYFASGTVSAVPIPTAAWLFGSALAGLGWLKRKRAI